MDAIQTPVFGDNEEATVWTLIRALFRSLLLQPSDHKNKHAATDGHELHAYYCHFIVARDFVNVNTEVTAF
jgi:hypothetical protein